MYIAYQIYVRFPSNKKQIWNRVASLDYFNSAVQRRNQLIETFGKDNVRIEKFIKK